ncbi:Arc family DNA-binding protein [Salmonella enterica subsp. enterica serovar Haifa]|uniref:YlcI/YnfO family protein n=1 Tax=Salmonella enterica TaxID=28901 RepID=UPI0009A9CBD2|nr:YlcI/YnfO family protein [Salmonella enterica]EAB8787699.1 Arc family DNA-binding protein [Salmonella enterica subsp. enterica serovar Haifa]EBW7573976.1 Arc family DNA-binding protein [Salmonella enterica subsp. enterica serovar Saintpaul]ECG1373295.1 Arc family DNA-binding protein [Salmonella enterica subsp. enterica serovar Stanley str. CFSAN000623]EDW5854289.1 Arc family DNA-binding protein [Salmonella enterica subsp. enterica]MIT24121.1 Arc family DNA-binding protein [Salmonella enteri
MTKRNPQFNVRIPPELKAEVEALAEKNKRSINAEVVAALEKAVAESKQEKKSYTYTMTYSKEDMERFREAMSSKLENIEKTLYILTKEKKA